MTPRAAHNLSSLRSRPPVDFDKLLAAARAPVDLAPLEWDGDTANEVGAMPWRNGALDREAPMTGEARTRRIRDRYIGARFPGAVSSAADLQSAERVIKSARLYFEDGHLETALELLDLAIEQDPRAEALWLAQLEILFLARRAARSTKCAMASRAAHAQSAHWLEVARLGHALAPTEPLFGAKRGPRNHDHYGPWPHLPNWIQASWDLTGEVLASDFHRLLKQGPSALAA
jgi:hypothetical protein